MDYKDYTMNPVEFLMMKRKEVNEESRRIMLREYKEKGLQEGLKQGLEQGLEQGLKEGLIKGSVNGQINTLTRLLKKIYHVDLREWLKRLTKEQLSLAKELILERLDYDKFIQKVEGEDSSY